ncbi:hypothetical protein NKG05_07505 [Oerskovia sp. M15]
MVLGALAPTASGAAADDATTAWSVTPVIDAGGAARSNFTYAVEPGQQVTDAALVRNSGADPLTVQVYASDAFTTAEGASTSPRGRRVGRPGNLGRGRGRRRHGPAGEQRRIAFTLTVPDDATPGDHAGALLTAVTQPGTSADGAGVAVDMRYATRITVRVAGTSSPRSRSWTWPWTTGGLLALAAREATTTYTARNTGNTRVTGRQVVAVTGPLGAGERVLESVPGSDFDDLPEVLPGDQLVVTAALDVPSWLGRADVEVGVSPEALALPGAVAPDMAVVTARSQGWGWRPGRGCFSASCSGSCPWRYGGGGGPRHLPRWRGRSSDPPTRPGCGCESDDALRARWALPFETAPGCVPGALLERKGSSRPSGLS